MDTRRIPAVDAPTAIAADALDGAFDEDEATPDGAITLDPELRDELIRRAAYAIAEQRGFAAGSELDDWLTAEAAIDAQLGRAAGRA